MVTIIMPHALPSVDSEKCSSRDLNSFFLESAHPFWNGGMEADRVEVTVAMRSYAFVTAHFLWILEGTMMGGGREKG